MPAVGGGGTVAGAAAAAGAADAARQRQRTVAAVVPSNVSSWGWLEPSDITVESTPDTEWHEVYFLTAPPHPDKSGPPSLFFLSPLEMLQPASAGAPAAQVACTWQGSCSSMTSALLLRAARGGASGLSSKLVLNVPAWCGQQTAGRCCHCGSQAHYPSLLNSVACGPSHYHDGCRRGAVLDNKLAASRQLAAEGLGPAVIAELQVPGLTAGDPPCTVQVCEWFGGGTVQLEDGQLHWEELGSLYGRLHSPAPDWFRASAAGLVAAGELPAGDHAASWAICSWVMPWLQRLFPTANRQALVAQGVDWAFLEAEIAGLPASSPPLVAHWCHRHPLTVAWPPFLQTNSLLPRTKTATVHGDIHEAN